MQITRSAPGLAAAEDKQLDLAVAASGQVAPAPRSLLPAGLPVESPLTVAVMGSVQRSPQGVLLRQQGLADVIAPVPECRWVALSMSWHAVPDGCHGSPDY